MRRRLWVIFSIIVLLTIGAASFKFWHDYQGTQNLKLTVWNQLSKSAKSTLTGWNNAKVTYAKKYIIVEFDAGKQSVLGNLTVYVNAHTKKVVKLISRC